MEETPRLDPWKLVIAAVMVFALVSVEVWLQGRFDASDHRKAEALVTGYRASPGGPSIAEVIQSRHPHITTADLSWSTEIQSSCLGSVRVVAHVPKRGEHAAASYAFEVLLTDSGIHPTDPETVKILQGLGARTATASQSRPAS